jgi:outer membrane murein-binding lipoprotein Lpp
MPQSSPHDPRHRRLTAPATALILLGTLLAGCGPEENKDLMKEVTQLKTDLKQTARSLNGAEISLEAKNEEVKAANAAAEAAKSKLTEKEEAVVLKDAQIKTLQDEVAVLKKGDAAVFAEITALQQKGQNVVALSRYQKFVTDFPKSSLVPSANSAIAQLTQVQKEIRRQVELIAPTKRTDKDLLKNFNEGYMTLQELAPALKKKTTAQVLELLGRPSRTYADGTEIGYEDKAINPATGTRGMLIIGFEAGVVSSLRVEYSGRRVTP